MKRMPLFVLTDFLALPAHVRAEAAVDCGSFPNSQMRLTCWNDTSRAMQADLPGQRSTANALAAPAKPKPVRASARKPIKSN
jgi:hypothetical protein